MVLGSFSNSYFTSKDSESGSREEIVTKSNDEGSEEEAWGEEIPVVPLLAEHVPIPHNEDGIRDRERQKEEHHLLQIVTLRLGLTESVHVAESCLECHRIGIFWL